MAVQRDGDGITLNIMEINNMNDEVKPKKSFDEIMFGQDEHGKSLSDYMQENAEQYEREAEKFWNEISYEDKLKAFYSVCKRIKEGDLKKKGSYRYVLYDVFEFDADAYSIGIECGYMDLHNSIVEEDDKRRSEIAEEIVSSDEFALLMKNSSGIDERIKSMYSRWKSWKEFCDHERSKNKS